MNPDSVLPSGILPLQSPTDHTGFIHIVDGIQSLYIDQNFFPVFRIGTVQFFGGIQLRNP